MILTLRTAFRQLTRNSAFSAAVVLTLALGLGSSLLIEALRSAYSDRSRRGFAQFRLASDGYFAAMGIPIVQGRAFDERDNAGALHSAVISRSQRKLNLAILGVFGGSALFLALVGIYGAVAFSVTRRTREIGLRIALGAPAARIVAAIVSRSLIVVGIGLAVGAVIATAGARVVSSMLNGITLYDPATYLCATIGLMLGAVLMSWWPAQRAARIEPTAALREQ